MKRYKVRQVLRLLKKDGWEIVRTKGDHRQFKNTKGKTGIVTVNGKKSDNLPGVTQQYLEASWMEMNSNMNKVIINIDWVPNNYGAAPENEGIACVSTGKTLEEVKHNILEAIEFHIEGMLADGEPVPEEFSGEWEPIFKLSTRAQLKYTGRYITRKALARETGIAEQQLSHYANGQRHPRPAMQERITDGIRAIASRLAVIL